MVTEAVNPEPEGEAAGRLIGEPGERASVSGAEAVDTE
jgi:hypothetical protein